jgi:hypothetical protein
VSDDHLWKAYWSSEPASDERRELGAKIVEHHLGFIIDYARRTGQFSWSQEAREDYLQDLIAVALERVDGYRGDMGAKFVTYLAPYLRPVRWKLIGNCAPVRVGYETARLTAETDRLVAEGITDPAVIAEHLSALHGKRFGVARIQRILSRPRFESGDRPLGDGAATVWDLHEGVAASVEDEAIGNVEGMDGIDVEVAGALAAAGLTDLERDIVVERLMRNPSDTDDEEGQVSLTTIALRHGISASTARDTERALVVRLRSMLAPIVGETSFGWQPELPFS